MLVSSIIKKMKNFVDVPDVLITFSRVGNVFFRCSVSVELICYRKELKCWFAKMSQN